MSLHDHWRRFTAPAKDYRRAIIFLSVTVLPGLVYLGFHPEARYHEPAAPPVAAKVSAPIDTGSQGTVLSRTDDGPAPSRRRRCYGSTGQLCEIVREGHFGCIDSKVGDKIGSFVVQGDKAAFRTMLTRTLASGECRAWSKGEMVFKQEGGFARFCLRAPGLEDCYWTDREAVED